MNKDMSNIGAWLVLMFTITVGAFGIAAGVEILKQESFELEQFSFVMDCIIIVLVGLGIAEYFFSKHRKERGIKDVMEPCNMEDSKGENMSFDKKALLVGEIIHGLGNSIINEKSKIGTLSTQDGKILQELGHALRVNLNVTSRRWIEEFPSLYSEGFNPFEHTQEFILEVVASFIGNEGMSFQQAVQENKALCRKHGIGEK
ncbi:hypothetical protein [Pseudoalteromonas luteoviolacea]|uniref:Uncharacterized protein n=1 Tax=Pseudoalteromonas luteoviolacea S4060-1 TaxID=1365257 RepID=A0A167KVB7_9GAMM|nr:hypothetical protein [Pseudoalteromonas luteoviolacea]KZN63338.1 hypothetical protein N478_03550 [Pseudoalteromonas luteoviolacea S4060-1]